MDAPDAAPAAARGGLKQHRIADPLRPCLRRRRVHRPAGPGADRNLAGLSQPLGGDLVAERAHGAGRRTQEGEVRRLAGVRQLWLLRGEAPAGPESVRPRLAGQADDAVDVEISAAVPPVGVAHQRLTEADRARSHAHEPRALVGVGVERDRLQRLAVLTGPGARGADEAHRRLAAIGHHDARQASAQSRLRAHAGAPPWPHAGRTRISGRRRRWL